MQKWMRDGLIGWGAATAFISILFIASVSLSGFGFLTVVMSLSGIPGGILLGRNREGWIWPTVGGILFVLAASIFLQFSWMLLCRSCEFG
jgi:hypothetical protein